MDRMDARLKEFFSEAIVPRGLTRRLVRRLARGPLTLEALAGRFRIEATARGVSRLHPGSGIGADSARGRGPPRGAASAPFRRAPDATPSRRAGSSASTWRGGGHSFRWPWIWRA